MNVMRKVVVSSSIVWLGWGVWVWCGVGGVGGYVWFVCRSWLFGFVVWGGVVVGGEEEELVEGVIVVGWCC